MLCLCRSSWSPLQSTEREQCQVEGLSTAETAEILGVSEDVVKTRFSRARHAIQQDLLDRTGAAAKTAFTFGQARCDRVVAAVLARIISQNTSDKRR